MKKEKKKKTESISEDKINLKTWRGRLWFCIVLLFIISLFVSISKNTNSFYDWYPGKGFDELRFGTKQNFIDSLYEKSDKNEATVKNDTIIMKNLPFFFDRGMFIDEPIVVIQTTYTKSTNNQITKSTEK